MGLIEKILYKLCRQPESRQEVEIRIIKPHAGETVYYFRPVVYDADKEAAFKKFLDAAKAGGLCTGYELSRLPWGELRVFRNPIFQSRDTGDWMEQKTVSSIRKYFSK